MQEIEQAEKTLSPEVSDNEMQKSASIGKFENSEALLKAYNNLEAEFTRKSQQLKELSKNIETKTDEKEVISTEIEGKNSVPDVKEEIPLFEKPEWREHLDAFLKANPIGKKYAKEIAEILVEDTALNKDKHCLDVALSRVLSNKLKNPVDILGDDKIREYVFTNEDLKSGIIKEYLESLSSQTLPKPITRGGAITAVPPRKVKTLEEAAQFAAEIIKNRRN